MEEQYLTKYDEVLLLDKGFAYEVFGTLCGTDSAGHEWFVDTEQPGEYLTFYATNPEKGLLLSGRTMTRQEFEETFT
jgi:hypothetical protein